jgi:co-chaperonin GroES (HSP10)
MICPTRDLVFISPDGAPTASAGGILYTTPPDPHTGRVIAVGPDADPLIQCGIRVLYNPGGGYDLVLPTAPDPVRVLRDADVWAIFSSPAEGEPDA